MGETRRNLARQVPWQAVQAGVYDCRWGTDAVRVVVAGELPRETHNAALHLFSASPELVAFGGGAYRRRSADTSTLLGQLAEQLRGEGFAVPYTMEDFRRKYVKEHFPQLTPEEQEDVLQALPLERRLAGLTPEQIQQYLDALKIAPAKPRKPRAQSKSLPDPRCTARIRSLERWKRGTHGRSQGQ
ncbi:MAG: hypothetical protein U0736_09255 [Gemmataceae bacterium]